MGFNSHGGRFGDSGISHYQKKESSDLKPGSTIYAHQGSFGSLFYCRDRGAVLKTDHPVYTTVGKMTASMTALEFSCYSPLMYCIIEKVLKEVRICAEYGLIHS